MFFEILTWEFQNSKGKIYLFYIITDTNNSCGSAKIIEVRTMYGIIYYKFPYQPYHSTYIIYYSMESLKLKLIQNLLGPKYNLEVSRRIIGKLYDVMNIF